MRPDMGRVVIEKERRGSSNPSAKVRHYGEFGEDGEYYGPMKLPSSGRKMVGWAGEKAIIGRKDPTDVLGPIYGYLRKNCGRPWDKVYSEICKVLGSGSFPIRHVLFDHVLPEVTKNYGQFKVDHNGILRERPRYRYQRPALIQDSDRVHITGSQWYVLINGVWYIGNYRKSPFDCVEAVRRTRPWQWSGTQSAPVEWPHFRDGWHGPIWVFTKIKQCSKKELRDLRKRLSIS